MSALNTAIDLVLFAVVVALWLALFVAAAFAVAGLSALLQWLYERCKS